MATWNPKADRTVGVEEGEYRSFCQSKYQMNQFAREAFEFFVQNTRVWIQYPEDFLIQLTHLESPTVFTEDVGKAIMTLVYVYRSEYKNKFLWLLRGLKEELTFFKFILSFTLPRNQSYFYDFMAWVSFVFSSTMFMYQEGKDFIQVARMCLANYRDMSHFVRAGGWDRFSECVGVMSTIYDRLAAVLRKEVHNDVGISRFLKYMAEQEKVKYEEPRRPYRSSGYLFSDDLVYKIDDIHERVTTMLESSSDGYVNETYEDELKAFIKAIRIEYSAETQSESQVEKLIKTGTKRSKSAESRHFSGGVQLTSQEKPKSDTTRFESPVKQSIEDRPLAQVSGQKQSVPTSSTGTTSTIYTRAGDLSVENRSDELESMDTDTEEENIQHPSPTKKIRQDP